MKGAIFAYPLIENAIRGKEKITHTTFEDGVRYMEFIEAVTRSAQAGEKIHLPF